MKNKILITLFIGIILSGCTGVGSKGLVGTGVSVAFDPRTVGTHLYNIKQKLNVSNQTELALIAIKSGLINP